MLGYPSPVALLLQQNLLPALFVLLVLPVLLVLHLVIVHLLLDQFPVGVIGTLHRPVEFMSRTVADHQLLLVVVWNVLRVIRVVLDRAPVVLMVLSRDRGLICGLARVQRAQRLVLHRGRVDRHRGVGVVVGLAIRDLGHAVGLVHHALGELGRVDAFRARVEFGGTYSAVWSDLGTTLGGGREGSGAGTGCFPVAQEGVATGCLGCTF